MKFNRKNLKIPQYLERIIKLFPHISSGRKNYEDQHIRILKNIDIVKKFIKNVDLAIIMKKEAGIKLARTYGILLIVPKLAWMDLHILML